jgi:mannosidase alpha-like ER degradation enhancer 2
MKRLFLFPLCAVLIMLALPSRAAAADAPRPGIDKERMAEEVKQEFLHSWNAYKKYAWGHDELRPLTKGSFDWYNTQFYLSALDALDTMMLMGLTDEADSTREYVATHLSWDRDTYVKVFEFTIRGLGGLLSSYQLTGDRRLLDLAEDLGRRMLPAFRSPTGMPYVNVNLRTGAVRGTVSNPGEVGTLLLEFGTLSKLTGKPEYYHYAKYAFLQAYRMRSPLGLVGQSFDVETGEWKNPDSHLSACIDSYYEYMVKCAILFGDEDCKLMWDTSYTAINRYLGETVHGRFWYGHADMNTGKRTKSWFGALDAFFPGTLVLAGDIPTAERLMASCLHMWNRHGIEPEQFDYVLDSAAAPKYFLNPEIMESAFYLYHATGKEVYLEMGKTFLDSLKQYCRVDAGYAQLRSVVTKEKYDRMESYFLAETLKYLYLLFAPPSTLRPQVVFNTEAHPLWKTW